MDINTFFDTCNAQGCRVGVMGVLGGIGRAEFEAAVMEVCLDLIRSDSI